MERRHVICPVTGRLEEVDLERTAAGVVITGCTRFEPREAVDCGRACAPDIDRSDRRNIDDRVERLLVVTPGSDELTRSLAQVLTEDLARDGLTAELADAGVRTAPPPEDYEAVVICSRLRFGRHPRSLIDYIARNRAALAGMPAFCVTLTTRPHDAIGRVVRETGWSPTSDLELVVSDRDLDRERIRELALRIAEEVPLLRHEPVMA